MFPMLGMFWYSISQRLKRIECLFDDYRERIVRLEMRMDTLEKQKG